MVNLTIHSPNDPNGAVDAITIEQDGSTYKVLKSYDENGVMSIRVLNENKECQMVQWNREWLGFLKKNTFYVNSGMNHKPIWTVQDIIDSIRKEWLFLNNAE